MHPALAHPEAIHPSLWRASQLARSSVRGVDTGHPELTAELPGGGWPAGALVELLAPQPGIGIGVALISVRFTGVGRPRCDNG